VNALTKQSRAGGKFGGDHTTFLDKAVVLADVAVTFPEVTRVSPGFIRMGTGTSSGASRVKFMRMHGGIFMKVRQGQSVQEVRVITHDPQSTMLALARAARNRGIEIYFEKRQK
jgi:hypothetical protein